jgi:hypothetical protein
LVQKIERKLRRLLLTGAAIAAVFFPVFSFSQAAPQSTGSKPTKALTIEAIYGEPGLSGRLAAGVAWTPDSKQLAFFESTGTGKDARREVWTMDAATGSRHLLIAADELATILPPDGKNIEIVLLPGRGHPASDPVGRIYLMKRVAAFFEKNLQGNFQGN